MRKTIKITRENTNSIVRTGFTVVEWGGRLHN